MLGVTRGEADAALGAVLRCIQEALAKGDRVVLTGFGAFEVREVMERRVRSVQPGGGVLRVPAHKRVGFVAGSELKSALKGGRD